MTASEQTPQQPPRIVVRPPRRNKTLKKRAVMTWAALAGLGAAAVFSSFVRDGGMIPGWFERDAGHVATAEIPTGPRRDHDGSPLTTSSIRSDTGARRIAELSAENARLKTIVRRGEIEKKALLRRIEEMRQAGNDPIADMVTGSLPDSTHRRRQPAIARDAAQTPDRGIRDALHRSMQADLAYAKARVSETQFAVEVATARSLSELRAHWDALAAKHTGIVGDLEPVVRVRETGAGLSLHLLAGPVRNAADAVDLCVRLRSTGALCAAVPYDGQRLE